MCAGQGGVGWRGPHIRLIVKPFAHTRKLLGLVCMCVWDRAVVVVAQQIENHDAEELADAQLLVSSSRKPTWTSVGGTAASSTTPMSISSPVPSPSLSSSLRWALCLRSRCSSLSIWLTGRTSGRVDEGVVAPAVELV